MCGIFGFITKDGRGPDVPRLKCIAAATEQRGRHAFGLAWVSRDGRLNTLKCPGPATSNLRDLDACADALLVIGHCRHATHGSPADNRNNHPHRAGRGWLVHNGVVHNYRELADAHRLARATECDSEVLGSLIARFSGSLLARAARTAAAAQYPLAFLGAWRNPARLLLVRNGNPLHIGATPRACYFGSLPIGLPGDATAFPDGFAAVLTYERGSLRYEIQRTRLQSSTTTSARGGQQPPFAGEQQP
jgi:glucosamine--fructose-6-phosphate aminotransferase (isomerizing)